VELQRSGKTNFQSHSSTGVRADVAAVLLKPSELKRNSADMAELDRRDFLPQNGIFFSLIGNEKRHFYLLFVDASDPNPNILFSYLGFEGWRCHFKNICI
jgi:hypothetical protein